MSPWMKRWKTDTAPIITPAEYERQKSEALDKLVQARELQQQISETTAPLRERNDVNHYAAGILRAYVLGAATK